MHVKTMEGLAGASTNYNLLKVPVRVFKEARRRGDMGTMERAMEYASDFAGKTRAYQEKAEEGMKEEAVEAEERKKLELEETIERRREEHRELEEQTESSKIPQTDTLEVSEEGKKLSESLNCSRPEIPQEKPEPLQNPLLYHQTGTVSPAEPAEGFIHISI